MFRSCEIQLVRKKIVSGLLAVALIGFGDRVNGSVFLASLLVPGSSFSVSDLLVFDQFAYCFTGDMPPPEELQVEMAVGGGGDLGIRLVGGMIETSAPGAVFFQSRVSCCSN